MVERTTAGRTGNGLDHLYNLVEQTQQMVVQLMDHVVALRKSHRTLEERFDVLEARFDSLEARFDSFQREAAARHTQVMTRLDTLTNEVGRLRGVVTEVLSNVETELAGAEARMERRLLTRDVRVDNHISERIVSLEARVQLLEDKVLAAQPG